MANRKPTAQRIAARGCRQSRDVLNRPGTVNECASWFWRELSMFGGKPENVDKQAFLSSVRQLLRELTRLSELGLRFEVE